MRISDWSSDVCSSDLAAQAQGAASAASMSRTAIEVDRVQQAKAKLDAAEAKGSSPLDVLFGASRRVLRKARRPRDPHPARAHRQIGRESARERACRYG